MFRLDLALRASRHCAANTAGGCEGVLCVNRTGIRADAGLGLTVALCLLADDTWSR